MTKSVKILLAIGAVALVVFIVCISLLLFLNFPKSPTWQEQYDLGIRYLSEGNYEEAIIAFTAAIDIDPKRPEAYQKAAEAYEAIGDSEAAREILEKGYAATGDRSLLPREETPGEESLLQQDAGSEEAVSETEWTIANFIRPEELTFGGVPFYETDIYAAKEYFDRNMPLDEYINELSVWDGDLVLPRQPEISQHIGDKFLAGISYNNALSLMLQPEFRDIYIGMPMIEALENLGFNSYFIGKIQNILAGDRSEVQVDYNGDLVMRETDLFYLGERPDISCRMTDMFTFEGYQWTVIVVIWRNVELTFTFKDNKLETVSFLNYLTNGPSN